MGLAKEDFENTWKGIDMIGRLMDETTFYN